MKRISIIGCGAIAQYVAKQLSQERELQLVAVIMLPGFEQVARDVMGAHIETALSVNELSERPDFAIDCAGHEALRQHGESILALGIDLASVSVGALADQDLYDALAAAARQSGAQLRIVSGAIGALDALSAAKVGGLNRVIYRGRKPPVGWIGSPAEEKLELSQLTEAAVHFRGTARNAALDYPKNANVAASVALAGMGFDDTEVELIADPGVSENIHEISAEGAFGRFDFQIRGRALPDNPRSSALAAMSVVRYALSQDAAIVV
ncbi:MAG: aspartate dehydrogenase [Gammaproteobacteria bacterium]|nr:aspartate dehydrogenase [Gammaproteobacteria bacterium]